MHPEPVGTGYAYAPCVTSFKTWDSTLEKALWEMLELTLLVCWNDLDSIKIRAKWSFSIGDPA